ncbi:ADA regulatory protein / O6-methylguanine-DNA methyltransferase (EC 2.1.1.63) [Mycetohabitans rhizoxinica HKI 454]|uniref:methylated-DNA--[protein]-cysteine S-methyltransferase n=2 Tax=Burkholderiaceae TaxID=119060 RepID=E5AKD9_MYCRK|nr:ADA regulatory protein / O6-methylguanine-DNA methyltransferase (EC 2.1.1.63) [Mycetohabitans rhizoxinica HKI 454]
MNDRVNMPVCPADRAGSSRAVAPKSASKTYHSLVMTHDTASQSSGAPGDYASDDARWAAVRAHDPCADGYFFFAVRTTGVFCRPSCKSRAPRRENVRFFESADAAMAEGFRACKRCQPLRAPREVELVARACSVLAERIDERVTLAQLGDAVHTSPYHLQRVFSRMMGISPRQYHANLRAERLRETLRSASSVTDAALGAGFESASPLRNAARGHLGMTPSAYRRQGAGMTIAYAIASTRLGPILIAATERGLCKVAFGDDEASLLHALHEEFRHAKRVCDPERLAHYVERIDAYLDGRADPTHLPFDGVATAFQRRVWDALRRIPYGQTRSYTEVAAELGVPNAVRAVAAACAANPVALVIPCHRVVQKSGALAGYRWGLQRKAALLDAERRDGDVRAATPGSETLDV